MPTLEPSEPPYNSESPDGGGWPRVAVLVVTATAVTVTAIHTHSVELIILVGTVLRGR
jgi:hypothetical protein